MIKKLERIKNFFIFLECFYLAPILTALFLNFVAFIKDVEIVTEIREEYLFAFFVFYGFEKIIDYLLYKEQLYDI